LLGSGSKPYTAAAVMRLVDQGKLSLDDKASRHIDGALQRLNGTTLVGLFGPKAANVTVGHLISMRSGISDFDVPTLDHAILTQGSATHSPMEVLWAVSKFPAADGCLTYNCTWVCAPGNCTSYSSTNFLLAGFVLITHAPEGQQTWQTYDQLAALGLTVAEYPHTRSPRLGPMSSQGLTVAGSSLDYGPATLYTQDASILGWTCGNVLASAQEVARFYWDLLGPMASIVSPASLAVMKNTTTLSQGWARGTIDYGSGLMIQNVSPNVSYRRPPLSDLASYIGHGGDTYAFMSDNGFFPQLNASISVIVNQDSDFEYPSYVVTCFVVQLAADFLGVGTPPNDLKCTAPQDLFTCRSVWGQKVCWPGSRGHESVSRANCSATCK